MKQEKRDNYFFLFVRQRSHFSATPLRVSQFASKATEKISI